MGRCYLSHYTFSICLIRGGKMSTFQTELPWILEARKYIGLKEIKGNQHNPTIIGWLKKLKSRWLDDETPWCGTFVSTCLQTCGLPVPKNWARALDFLSIGVPIARPAYGCIVVFEREGGGHVGFVVGVDKQGRLMVLGGNQGDMVRISAFELSRVKGYRWPNIAPTKQRYNLPVLESNGLVSTNEV